MTLGEVLAVIPARYGSTRFPGKPLALLAGKPLLWWVCHQAKRVFPRVVVATDDTRILRAVQKWGEEALMTSRFCHNGTERVVEVAQRIPASVYINIQGDEPCIPPSLLRQLVGAFEDPKTHMVTAACSLKNSQEVQDPNVVKVVCDHEGYALYFSRSPIPYSKNSSALSSWLRHIGLYGYRKGIVEQWKRWSPCALEQRENLEQLRALYYGDSMQVIQAKSFGRGVDTPEDLKRLQSIFRK